MRPIDYRPERERRYMAAFGIILIGLTVAAMIAMLIIMAIARPWETGIFAGIIVLIVGATLWLAPRIPERWIE